jgi:uncharacterized protein
MRTRLRAAATVLAGVVLAASMVGCGSAPEHDDFQVQLGDFTARARVDRPASGRAPAVVLVHGTGPRDLDQTVEGYDGTIRSRIFADLARYLSARGYAVVRYDKRYVDGAGSFDEARFANLTQQDQVADVESVIRAAKRNPHVDPERLFLYGWSEGSTIAAEYATQHTDLDGLILQGGVNVSWRDGLVDQATSVAEPYLRRYAKAGSLDAEGLRLAWLGAGGLQVKEWITFVAADGSFTPSPVFDRDQDGRVALDSEWRAAVPAFVDALLAPDGPLASWDPAGVCRPCRSRQRNCGSRYSCCRGRTTGTCRRPPRTCWMRRCAGTATWTTHCGCIPGWGTRSARPSTAPRTTCARSTVSPWRTSWSGSISRPTIDLDPGSGRTLAR